MDLKKEFPFTAHSINCNNAGICPPPLRASEEAIRCSRRFTEAGFPALITEFPQRDQTVRKKLARLLGSSEERFAITHNTAEGLNIIAQGYPFQPGDRILTADKEYPANVYPWLNLEYKGVTLDFVEEEPDGSLPAEKIQDYIRPETVMLTISFVEWCTGFRNNLKLLAEICREKGIHLIVDGAQGVGALQLNVEEADIDALACPAWKWLWGPLGLGFLYMKPSFMNKIRQLFVGAEGVAGYDRLLDYKLIPRDGMLRFEYATKNYADIVTFDKSLELTLEIGMAAVEKRVLSVAGAFQEAVRSAGGTIFGDYPGENRSGIFSCTFPATDPGKLRKELARRNVLANVRDNRLRIAPHAYLDREDAIRFAEKIKGALKASS